MVKKIFSVLNLKEKKELYILLLLLVIGSLLEVTESRISQLHTRGLEGLKEYIEKYEKKKGKI